MLIFLPDYLDEASLYGEDSPCVCPVSYTHLDGISEEIASP